MKFLLTLLVLTSSYCALAQDIAKDFYLKKSLKQNGFQYQFTVLDEDKKGVFSYDKEKFYYWYKAQKVLSTQGASSGQLLNGDFEAFHVNKQLAEKGSFYKGLKNDKWMYWRSDGTLILIENWKKGKFSGSTECFDETGVSQKIVCYKLCSKSITTKDSVVIEKNYRDKKIVQIKDSDGLVVSRVVYRKGKIVEKKKQRETKLKSWFKRILKKKNHKDGEVKKENSDKHNFFKRNKKEDA